MNALLGLISIIQCPKCLQSLCFKGLTDANPVCISFVEAAPRAAAQGQDSHKLVWRLNLSSQGKNTWRIKYRSFDFEDRILNMHFCRMTGFLCFFSTNRQTICWCRSILWSIWERWLGPKGWDFPAAATLMQRAAAFVGPVACSCLRLLGGRLSWCTQWTMYKKIVWGPSRWGIPRSFAHWLGMGENDFPLWLNQGMATWKQRFREARWAAQTTL